MTRAFAAVLTAILAMCSAGPGTPIPQASPTFLAQVTPDPTADARRRRTPPPATPTPAPIATPTVVLLPTPPPATPIPTGTQVAGGNIFGGSPGPLPPTPTPTASAAVLYFQQVKNNGPCAYYRLNDDIATPTFTTVMADSSVNNAPGNYAPNVPRTTGITNNNGGATAISVPGGAWANTNQAFGPTPPQGFQQPSAGVQLEFLAATQSTIQAASMVGFGGNTGTAATPNEYQFMTYQTPGNASASQTITLNTAANWQGHGTVPLSTDNGGNVHLELIVNYSDDGSGVILATPAGWTSKSAVDTSFIHNRVYDFPLTGTIPASVLLSFSSGLGAAQVNAWVVEVTQTTGVDIVTTNTAAVTSPWNTSTGTGTQTGLNDLGIVFDSINDGILTLNALTGYNGLGANNGTLGLHGAGGSFGSTAAVLVGTSLITTPSVPAQTTGWTNGFGTENVIGSQILMAPSTTASAPAPYQVSLDAGGHFVFSVNVGNTKHSVTSTTVITRGTIYHIVGTYTGASQYITINGSKQGTTALSGPITGYDTTSGLAIGGQWNNDGSTLQFGGVLSDVAIYCGANLITDTQISNDFNLSAGAATPTPTPAPTSTPTPSGCVTPGPLVNGQEPGPANFVLFSCTQSSWNVPLPSGGATSVPATWSQPVITSQFQNGNASGSGLDGPFDSIWSGQFDVGHSLYFASAGDPTVNFHCTPGSCDTTDNGGLPPTIKVPAGMRWPCSNTDNHVTVIQPDGTEIDMYTFNSCITGSGTNGDFQTGDTINVGSADNCGNWLTGGTGFGWLTGANDTVAAGGQCGWAGIVRANELLAGYISHAMILILDCNSNSSGSYSVFPSPPGSDTQHCTNGGASGPPLGARLHYKNWCNATGGPVTAANFPNGLPGTGYKPWELAVLCALNQRGAFYTDNFGGGAQVGGIYLQPTGGQMFTAFGQTSPYAQLANPPNNWTIQNPITGATSPRWFGADPWNPPGFTATYWQNNFEYLDPCESHVPRTC